jgi:hypothetical protein
MLATRYMRVGVAHASGRSGGVSMPRKSVYFPDEQWPRIEQAAELEDRSVSKWLQRAAERALPKLPSSEDLLGPAEYHRPDCQCYSCRPGVRQTR